MMHSAARVTLEERSRMLLRSQAMLRAFLRSLVPSPADVDDLLQEVGVCVLSDLDSPVPPGKFGAWSRGIARNLVLRLRRARARSALPLTEDYVALVERAFEEAEEREAEQRWVERRHALAHCLTQLNHNARGLLEERYLAEARSDEIGRSHGRSPVAVRKALMKIRRKLQRCIDERLASPREVPS